MTSRLLDLWAESAFTSLSFFWMALWAFVLGYVISSAIQVFVTRARMKRAMGEAGGRSVALGTFFGFISSSCSFAALSTTRALFQKGAGLVPALAFLLASTNLVIELGFVIAVFLSWQFVVGEYLGGILLILLVWLIVRLFRPGRLVEEARERAGGDGDDGGDEVPDWRRLIVSPAGWRKVAGRYFMEWGMVWKDVTIGFTVAGIISAMVPREFFETLFVGSGGGELSFWQVLEHALVGPVAAFFTFIGSMGNVPLAGVLYANGVSFAGIMAFLFSDLVVFPVLRIQSQYYGWKMALYILAVFLVALVATALLLHYGFTWSGLVPDVGAGRSGSAGPGFAIDHTFFLNLAAVAVTGVLAWLAFSRRSGSDDHGHHDHGGGRDLLKSILRVLAWCCYGWLAVGLVLHFTIAARGG